MPPAIITDATATGGISSSPTSGAISADTGVGGILSGLGGLFSGVAGGIGTIIKAQQPAPSYYNPYYTATGVNTSVSQQGLFGSLFSSPIVLLLVGLGVYLLARKK